MTQQAITPVAHDGITSIDNAGAAVHEIDARVIRDCVKAEEAVGAKIIDIDAGRVKSFVATRGHNGQMTATLFESKVVVPLVRKQKAALVAAGNAALVGSSATLVNITVPAGSQRHICDLYFTYHVGGQSFERPVNVKYGALVDTVLGGVTSICGAGVVGKKKAAIIEDAIAAYNNNMVAVHGYGVLAFSTRGGNLTARALDVVYMPAGDWLYIDARANPHIRINRAFTMWDSDSFTGKSSEAARAFLDNMADIIATHHETQGGRYRAARNSLTPVKVIESTKRHTRGKNAGQGVLDFGKIADGH